MTKQHTMQPKRGDDNAYGAVLAIEAIIIAIMFVAVAAWLDSTTNRPGTSSTDGAWDVIKGKTDTWLRIAYALPSTNLSHYTEDHTRGDNLLERFIRDRYNHEADGAHNFRLLNQMYYNNPAIVVQLDHRIATDAVTLYATHKGDPRGENLALSKYVIPTYNAIHIAPRIEPLDGTTPLVAEALFLNQSQTIRPPGDTIRMTVQRDWLHTPLNTNTNITTHTLTTQTTNQPKPAISITWTRFAEEPTGGQSHYTLLTPPSHETTSTFEATIRADTFNAVPPLQAHATIGPGFKDHTPVLNGEWVPAGTVDLADGSTRVSWTRVTNLTADTNYGLEFRAKRNENVTPDYTFLHLTITGTTMARSTAAVRHAYNPVDQTRPASLHPTAPYEATPGTTARLGAVYVNGPDPTTIKRFTITVPGAYDIHHHDGEGAHLFNTSRTLTPVTPTNTSSTDPCETTTSRWYFLTTNKIQWCGTQQLLPFEPFTFIVDAPIKHATTTTPTRPNQRQHATSTTNLYHNYHTSNLTFQANNHIATPNDGPGAWRDTPTLTRFRIPPQTATTAGYPTLTHGNGQTGNNNHINASYHWTNPTFTTPHAPATFSLQPAVPSITTLQAAVLNSTITPHERLITAGDTATFTINHNALFQELDNLGSLITNIKHRAEHYTPANFPNQPFLVTEDAIDVTTASPISTIHAHDTTPGGDHEIHVTTQGGQALLYATTAGDPTPTPPLWDSSISGHPVDETAAYIVTNADPTTAAHEALVVTQRGDAQLINPQTGATLWHRTLGTPTYTAAVDHRPLSNLGLPQGRVYVANATTQQTTRIIALDPANGVTIATATVASTTSPDHALSPFNHPQALDDRAVLHARTNGELTALDKDLNTLWTLTLPGIPGKLLHANASDFDQNPGNGDELLIVYGTQAFLVNSTGTPLTTWVPGVTITLATTTDIHADTAPELAVAVADHSLTVLTLDNPPAQFTIIATFGPTDLRDPGTNTGKLQTPVLTPVSCNDPTAITYEDARDLGFHICPQPDPSTAAGAANLQRTHLALTRDPSGTHNPTLAVASHAGDFLYLEAYDVTTQTRAWGPLKSSNMNEVATAFTWTPNKTPAQNPDAPFLTLGTTTGNVYLLNMNDGSSAWTSPVTPHTGHGPITVYFQTPSSALPGTHVIKSTLQWDQTVAGGKLTQRAHLLTYVEVAKSNREFIRGDYWLAADVRAWLMDWD